jgi:hypothetical protein
MPLPVNELIPLNIQQALKKQCKYCFIYAVFLPVFIYDVINKDKSAVANFKIDHNTP